MKSLRLLSLAIAVTFTTSTVVAQDLLPPSGDLVFKSAAYYWNGVGVGPYTGSVPGHETIDIYCVDFSHYAPTSPRTYNFTNLNDANTDNSLLDVTRWGSGNLDNYKRAAYLTTFFNSIINDGSLTSSERDEKVGRLHSAIWHLFNPTKPSWATSDTDNEWYSKVNQGCVDGVPGSCAYQQYFASNAAYWFIGSDQLIDGSNRGAYGEASGGKQEYLIFVAPEPSTLILLGSGLLGLAYAVRRRKGPGNHEV